MPVVWLGSGRRVWGLLAFAAVGALGCADKPTSASAPSKATPVESKLSRVVLDAKQVERLGIKTAPVEERALASTLSAVGDVVARPGRSSVIQAPVAGVLLGGGASASSPLPGSTLRAGDVVFRLLPLVTPDRNQQAEARRDVELARTRALTAERQVQRLTSLGKEGVGDEPLLETKQADADMAKSDLAAAEVRLSQLTGASPLTSDVSLALKAPQGGVLVRVLATGGQSVSAGAPLFEIAELDRLWVEVPLYVGDVDRVDRTAAASLSSLGAKATQDLVPAQPLSAPPIGEASTATARLFYEIDNAGQRFSPGQRVAMRLPLVGQNEPRLVAPYAAVVHDVLGGAWVYVVRGPTEFERVRVEVERVQGNLAVLSRGPKAGTVLAVEGTAELFGTEFGAGK